MIHFNEIAARYGIGMLLSTPTPVLGGLLHTTYRLDAAEGSFAVKILNPAVMKRPIHIDTAPLGNVSGTGPQPHVTCATTFL